MKIVALPLWNTATHPIMVPHMTRAEAISLGERLGERGWDIYLGEEDEEPADRQEQSVQSNGRMEGWDAQVRKCARAKSH